MGKNKAIACLHDVIGLLCIYGVSDTAMVTARLVKYDYGVIRKELRDTIPEDSTVMGAGLYYFSFTDRPEKFMSYIFIGAGCPDFGNTIRRYKPDYIIVDPALYKLSKLWCTIPGKEGGQRVYQQKGLSGEGGVLSLSQQARP